MINYNCNYNNNYNNIIYNNCLRSNDSTYLYLFKQYYIYFIGPINNLSKYIVFINNINIFLIYQNS